MQSPRVHRGLAVIGAAALATALLTACGADSGGPANSQEEDINLRVMIFSSNEAHLELLNGIADDYMAEHPEVTEITFESVPSTELRTVLQTQIAASQGPDISWATDHLSAEWIANELTIDLAPELSSDEAYEWDDLIPNALNLWKRGDAQYGMPFSTSTMGMFYNADLFAQAGAPNPDELIAEGKWNWDEYREVLKQVTAATGVSGFVARDFEFGKQLDRLVPIWYAYGASPWNADGTECTFAEPEMVGAMQMLHDMIYVDGTYPPVGRTVDFFAGGAASTNAFVSASGLLADVDFNWGFVPMPAGPDGDTPALYQSSFVAYESSKNPASAVDFVKFLTNPDNSAKLAQFFPSIRQSVSTAENLSEINGWLSPEQMETVVVRGLTDGEFVPVHVDQGRILSAISAPLDGMFVADADVAAVMQDVCGAIDPLLK